MKMDSHPPGILTASLCDQDVPSSGWGPNHPASPNPSTVDWALSPGTKVGTLPIHSEQGLPRSLAPRIWSQASPVLCVVF